MSSSGSDGDDFEQPSDSEGTSLLHKLRSLDSDKVENGGAKRRRLLPPTQDSSGAHGALSVDQMVHAIKSTAQLREVRKQAKAKSKSKSATVLDPPTHRQQRQKVERAIAYKKVLHELDDWEPIVTTNRTADKLVFPLNQEKAPRPSADHLTEVFQPHSSLERRTAEVLNKSGCQVKAGEMLTEAEKKILAAMDLAQAQERLAELRKHRYLLSYLEAKQRRQAKIKSKAYRKRLSRARSKTAIKELELLRERDPEEYSRRLDLLDKERVQERATQRRTAAGGSQWSRRMSRLSKANPELRLELQEQIRLRGEKLHKNAAKTSHGSDSSDEEISEDDDKRLEKVLSNASEAGTSGTTSGTVPESLQDNPWLKGPQDKKVLKEKMKRVRGKLLSGEKVVGVSEGQLSGINKAIGDSMPVRFSGAEDPVKENATNENVVSAPSDGNDRKTEIKKRKRMKLTNGDDADDSMSKGVGKVKKSKKEKKDGMSSRNESLEFQGSHSQNTAEADIIHESLAADSDDETARKSISSGTKTKSKPRKAIESRETSKSGDIDATKFVAPRQHRPKIDLAPQLIQMVDGEHDDAAASSKQLQSELLSAAFADDDLLQEFAAEKRDLASSGDALQLQKDAAMMGWGTWAGPGLSKAERKRSERRRAAAINSSLKVEPKTRQDSNLSHVIINQKESDTLQRYQVRQLPFPHRVWDCPQERAGFQCDYNSAFGAGVEHARRSSGTCCSEGSHKNRRHNTTNEQSECFTCEKGRSQTKNAPQEGAKMGYGRFPH